MLTLTLLAASALFAQSDMAVLSAGYSAPAPIEVAPGQVVTLFTRGIGPGSGVPLRKAEATQTPLPNTLAGVALTVDQRPVPILALRQTNDCDDSNMDPICILTAIRVQIPSELTLGMQKLIFEVDGQRSRMFPLRLVHQNAHVITTCDLRWDTNPTADCQRPIYHADGRLVTNSAPATTGETLVIYLHGLGATLPRVPSGEAAPSGVAVPIAGLHVGLEVLLNAPGNLPMYQNATPYGDNALTHTGVTAGQVGLYQMNIRVPDSFTVPIACGGETRTNVIARVTTALGTENVSFCVAK